MSTKGTVSVNQKNERLMKFVNYIMKEGKKYLALKIVTKRL